jgi:hypothetical protein
MRGARDRMGLVGMSQLIGEDENLHLRIKGYYPK